MSALNLYYLLDLRYRGVDERAIIIEWVGVIAKTHCRVEVDSTCVDVRATDESLVRVLITVGITDSHIYCEPLGKFVREVDTTCYAVEARALHDTLVVGVAERTVVVRVARATVEREVVVLEESWASNSVLPVCTLTESVRVKLCRSRWVVASRVVVSVTNKLLRIHQVELASKHRDTHLCFCCNIEFVHLTLTALGSNDDNTVGTASTVDSSRRGIFEHRDVVDIRRVDIAEVLHSVDHTIDNDEWLIRSTYRTGTTNTDRCCSSWLTCCGHNIHTGDTTLERLVNRGYRSLVCISHFD